MTLFIAALLAAVALGIVNVLIVLQVARLAERIESSPSTDGRAATLLGTSTVRN